eukprot:129220-Pyramimonas_sp.AAC.1
MASAPPCPAEDTSQLSMDGLLNQLLQSEPEPQTAAPLAITDTDHDVKPVPHVRINQRKSSMTRRTIAAQIAKKIDASPIM